LDLGKWADHKISTLSGGTRQRVSLAAALIHDPALVLLDEPTTGLDIAQKASFRRLLDQVARDRAVLISSHDVADLVKRTQTVLVLVEGRIVAKGSPDQLMGMSNALTLEAAYLRIVSKAGKESRGASSAP
jgi:ABC-2 type transport system ATP-binding protein